MFLDGSTILDAGGIGPVTLVNWGGLGSAVNSNMICFSLYNILRKLRLRAGGG